MAYTQFSHSLCMEVTLQDALKAQCSLLSRRKAVERLCITSYEMTVHVILSYPPPPGPYPRVRVRAGLGTRLVRSLVPRIYRSSAVCSFPGQGGRVRTLEQNLITRTDHSMLWRRREPLSCVLIPLLLEVRQGRRQQLYSSYTATIK